MEKCQNTHTVCVAALIFANDKLMKYKRSTIEAQQFVRYSSQQLMRWICVGPETPMGWKDTMRRVYVLHTLTSWLKINYTHKSSKHDYKHSLSRFLKYAQHSLTPLVCADIVCLQIDPTNSHSTSTFAFTWLRRSTTTTTQTDCCVVHQTAVKINLASEKNGDACLVIRECRLGYRTLCELCE